MADKSTDNLRDKLNGPIKTTNDILYRGIVSQLGAPVITDYANDKLKWWDKWINKAYTDYLGAKFIENTKIDKSRQPVAAFTLNPNAQLRIPQYNYGQLWELAQNHWLLQTIYRVVIGEIINAGWKIAPRYKYKCRRCGKEYDTPDPPDTCEICEGKRFDKPDIENYKEFRRILEDPAPGQDKSFTEFVTSTYNYNLSLDDFYWEIGTKLDYDTVTKKYIRVPIGIRVLNSAITLPLQDVYGNFSSPEYFCPICYKEQYFETKRDNFVDIRSLPQNQQNKPPTCPRCGESMERTAYEQIVNGKVVTRFAEDEVIHVAPNRVDPNIFGQSKVVSAIKHLLIIDYMDEYNYQIYSHGHISKLLFLVGSDTDEISRINIAVNNALTSKSKRNVQTGELERNMETAIVMVGQEDGKAVNEVDIMPDLNAMQSLDYYRLYVNKVCGLYGTTPIFVNFAESDGASNNSRMEIDVQNRVIRRYMHDFLESFNNKLLPALGIEDWILEFGEIESRDMLRDAQIKQTNMMAISLAIGSGFDVEVEPDASKYRLSPKPVREPEQRSREESGKIPQNQDGSARRTMPSGQGDGIPIQEPEDNDSE